MVSADSGQQGGEFPECREPQQKEDTSIGMFWGVCAWQALDSSLIPHPTTFNLNISPELRILPGTPELGCKEGKRKAPSV